MPKITVDGKNLEVPAGQTIIQACDKAGIDIPRYCYHPGLPVAGNCRICLVQVEKMPKLTIACNTQVAEGMVIHTQSEAVKDTRKAVLEFLLINHPLDCPVCDQAGECWLQDYYMQHGQYDSRFIENKQKKHKAQKIGTYVMLDSERCILCTRCVRFCDEITKTHELGIVNRGDREELVVADGKELNNNYSGNTVDICPVGALTDRDFRFQTRVWYLTETPSVCPGCSKGCNISIHANRSHPYKAGGKRVARLKPRYHAEVNEWWMCDTGRYGYTSIDAAERIQKASQTLAEKTQHADMDTIIEKAAQSLLSAAKTGQAGMLVSASLTTEELYLAQRVSKKLKIKMLAFPLNPAGEADGFLLQADRNPNTAALKLLGYPLIPSAKALEERLSESDFKTLYVLGHDLETLCGQGVLDHLKNMDCVIFQGTHENTTSQKAQLVIPGAVYAEKEGTFINGEGRIQMIRQAVKPVGEALAGWEIFIKLGEFLSAGLGDLRTPAEVFTELAKEIPDLNGLTYEKIGTSGQLVGAPEHQRTRTPETSDKRTRDKHA